MDKYETAALNFANRERKKQGKEPLEELPKGYPCSAGFCPIANAIEMLVTERGDLSRVPSRWPDTRTAVEFIARFDAGKYPHLEQA